MEDKVTLYIATHNITGKKYFGKTCRWFSKEDLQKNYHGSGEYWKLHKKKHGDKDVTMEIYKICSLNESDEDYVVPIAIKFSEENDIVKSKEWANQKSENGLDGGSEKGVHKSEETKKKMKESAKNRTTNNRTGKPHSEETKKKMSISQKGKVVSEETKKKISKTLKEQPGRPHTEESKEKMKNSAKNREKGGGMTGKPHSEETKKKMGKPKNKIICPFCSKIGGDSQMKRWHFQNCKSLLDK